jgi:hypothetical protein
MAKATPCRGGFGHGTFSARFRLKFHNFVAIYLQIGQIDKLLVGD